jgi:DNA-binding CsgD family transcriptional regulator
MIEFTLSPDGRDIIIYENGQTKHLGAEDHNFIDQVCEHIRSNYPECNKALDIIYSKSFQYKYLKSRRFIKCNFSLTDHIPDITATDDYNVEYIHCPLRGECKFENIICSPKLTTALTERETEIVKCLCDNCTEMEIADRLFISIHTVHQHLRNIRRKTNSRSMPEIINWANKNAINKNNI